jgi:hypothetical protein
LASNFIKVILGAALMASLFAAGQNVYRRLPEAALGSTADVNDQGAQTEVTIAIYDAPELNGKGNDVEIELYPIDFQSVQQDFLDLPRPGKTFDEFLARRIREKTPVRTQFDRNGRASVNVSQGKWWIRATLKLSDNESMEWRLPIVVSGRKQTVELTSQNIYERTKQF